MASERPARRATKKPAASRTGGAETAPMQPPAAASRYVDFDPWAMLAELMETPEESAPAERNRSKGK